MNISFYFQNVDKSCEQQLKNYLTEKKLNRLTRLLQHGSLQLAGLRIHVEYFQHHNDFLVRLTLNIGKQVFVSEERKYKTLETFDIAFDELISQLRKLESIKHDK